MPDITSATDPIITGAGGAAAAGGVFALLRMLVGRNLKATEDSQRELWRRAEDHTRVMNEIRVDLARLAGRMDAAEAAISNDKQGRAAVVEMQQHMAAMREAVDHLRDSMADMRDRLNAAPPRRRPSAAE